MKHFRFLLPIFVLGLLVTSCGKETCEMCEVVQTITEDDVVIGTQTLNTNQEYCGDALEAIKATEASITQMLDGVTIVTETTVNCQ